MVNWKRFSILTMVFVLLFVLAACGNNNANNSESNGGNDGANKKPAEKKDKVTLDYMWFTDGVEGEVMKSIIEDYENENPNVDINMIEVAYKDLNTKLKTMIAGGKPPALSRVTDTGNFANQALVMNDYLDDIEGFTSQFMGSVKPYYVIDGKVIGVPMDVTANGLIYNKTLFEKAGVQVPQSPDEVWTWDEFAAKLQEVMDKGGAKYGLVWDFTPHRWSTMLYQFGSSMFTPDGTSTTINDENGVAALEYFVKLHEDGIIPKSVWLGGENPNNLFRTGTVAAHLSGNWMLSNYKDIENFEWGVTYLPKQATRSSVPGGKYVMGFKGTGVEEETADFIKYLASQEVNAKYTSESLFISPRLDNGTLDYSFGKEMFEVFSNELANTPEAAANDWSRQMVVTKFATDLKDNIVEAITGNMTPQESMDATAEKIKKAIADVKE